MQYEQLRSPFDAAAATYDADFSTTRVGRWMREAVWQQIEGLYRAGDHVLDLGCGTGEDTVWLARRGVSVTALDRSAGMLAVARQKVAATGLAGSVDLVHVDLAELGQALPAAEPHYDGALANFGVLNCLADQRPLAGWLANQIKPGCRIVLVMLGPMCVWEIGWHLLRGDLRRAFRRMKAGQPAHTGGGGTVLVWFSTIEQLCAAYARWFRPVGLAAIGGLLPPPYLESVVARHPQLFGTLALLDRRMASTWPWPWMSDHYLIVFERRLHDPY